MTGRVTTTFTATSTADEVLEGVDLSDRRAVVTGASSGLGAETARALAVAGAEVTLLVRDVDAGESVADAIRRLTGRAAVTVAHIDLADLQSVDAFTAGWSGPLDILVNNAGVMSLPLQRTSRGWEMHLAVNHLGHFALATALHRWLAASGRARVVSLSSGEHLVGPFDFDDPHFDRQPYDDRLAYARSKTANALFAVGADARWSADGIRVNSVMPGVIHTNLMRRIDPDLLERVKESGGFHWKTVEQGAATSVLLAASPLVEGIGGRYFADGSEAEPSDGPHHGVARHATDPELADRLWELSSKLVGGR